MGAVAKAPDELVRREWIALDDHDDDGQPTLLQPVVNQSALSKTAIDQSATSKLGATATPVAVPERPDGVVLGVGEENGNDHGGGLVVVLKNTLPPKVYILACHVPKYIISVQSLRTTVRGNDIRRKRTQDNPANHMSRTCKFVLLYVFPNLSCCGDRCSH